MLSTRDDNRKGDPGVGHCLEPKTVAPVHFP
jgi:hypothetical protein